VTLRLHDSADEATLRDVYRRFFAEHCSTEVVRRAEPTGHDPQLWSRLIGLGAPGMAAPEAVGGGGGSRFDLMVVAEEAGRVLAPVPLIEHQLAAALLAAHAPRRFDDVLDGTTIATLALRPSLDGWWRIVPGAAFAGVVVGVHDGSLITVRQSPSGKHEPNGAAQAFADVLADGARIAEAEDFLATLDAWRVLTAAQLVGASEAVLAIGIAYVLDRHQFGRPIGSYQAIQHGLSELPGLINGARLVAGKAAWAHEHDAPSFIDLDHNDITDPASLASMALLFAAEAGAQTVDRVLQYHGAIGCAMENDVQLYYRRIRSWPLVLAPKQVERQHLAALLMSS
jgi:alkylation response protein AidB-like acyl-CoA dehydrogenase